MEKYENCKRYSKKSQKRMECANRVAEAIVNNSINKFQDFKNRILTSVIPTGLALKAARAARAAKAAREAKAARAAKAGRPAKKKLKRETEKKESRKKESWEFNIKIPKNNGKEGLCIIYRKKGKSKVLSASLVLRKQEKNTLYLHSFSKASNIKPGAPVRLMRKVIAMAKKQGIKKIHLVPQGFETKISKKAPKRSTLERLYSTFGFQVEYYKNSKWGMVLNL